MPLAHFRGTQTNPEARVPRRGLRTRRCAVRRDGVLSLQVLQELRIERVK